MQLPSLTLVWLHFAVLEPALLLHWPFGGREDDNLALNPHWSSHAVDYASEMVGPGAGRRSHSCLESLSKPPTPPKKPYAQQAVAPVSSVTTATALESTIYIRHSSHLSIKAWLFLPVNHFRPTKYPPPPPKCWGHSSSATELKKLPSPALCKRHTYIHTHSKCGCVQRCTDSVIWWNRRICSGRLACLLQSPRESLKGIRCSFYSYR